MIIRTLRKKDQKWEKSLVSADFEESFLFKGDTEIFLKAVARFIEMSEILGDLFDFGSIISFPSSEILDFVYTIVPFKNFSKFSNNGKTQKQYGEYNKIINERKAKIYQFKDSTTYKFVKIIEGGLVKNLHQRSRFKSIIYANPNNSQESYEIIEGHLLVRSCTEQLEIGDHSIKNDFVSVWKKVFGDSLSLMVGIPIYTEMAREILPFTFIWVFSFEDFNIDDYIYRNLLFNWIEDFRILFERLFSKIEGYYLDHYKRKQVEYALRSAVAAIMARNMSHNIGSHVLNYLSNPEELDNLWII